MIGALTYVIVSPVDPLSGLLTGPRAQGAFVLQTRVDPPWSLRVADGAPLTTFAVVRGAAWVTPTGGESRRLAAGDVAVVAGREPYVVADDPATAPQVEILPGQVCRTLEGEPRMIDLGTRQWGRDGAAATVLVTGTYETAAEVSRPLLAALPPLLVLRAGDWDSPWLGLLADAAVRDAPGQDAVVDRVLDLLLVAVLRAWFARDEADAPGWYRAEADPVVGGALRALRADPARAWTVDELARAAGLSRAAFARRFQRLVGEGPMTYLTGWRLALAADLLLGTDLTLTAIARQVGYGTPFSLSAAFSRRYGRSPQRFRTAA